MGRCTGGPRREPRRTDDAIEGCDPSLLAGLVYDANGERMSPTHANKKGTHYRYYVSQSLIKRSRPQASETACRVPAADLEGIVEQRICALLRDQTTMLDASGTITVAARKMLIVNAADLARRWPTLPASDRRGLLHALIVRIDVGAEAIEISVRPKVLPAFVTPDLDIRRLPVSPDGMPLVLSVPARLKRTGMEMTLLVQGALSSEPPRKHDRSLQRLIAQAQRLSDLVMNSKGRPIRDLAVEAGVSPSYFTRVFRLSFLAPEITTAIVHGRQPAELSAIKLLRAGRLARRWPDQRRQLGFGWSHRSAELAPTG